MKEALKFNYKKATEEDIKVLVSSRIEVLLAANNLPKSTDMSLVEKESYEYYSNCFKKDEHVAYLVYQGDEFVGCGGVSFYKVMPTYSNPSGKKAYIMNIYTRPEYRKNGIATQTLDLLVSEAKKRNIPQISLEATDMGRPIYEKYGFVSMEHEMELK